LKDVVEAAKVGPAAEIARPAGRAGVAGLAVHAPAATRDAAEEQHRVMLAPTRRVRQDLIGLVHFFEASLSLSGAAVGIRVPLASEHPVSLLDVVV
jgi:hypothetical protein